MKLFNLYCALVFAAFGHSTPLWPFGIVGALLGGGSSSSNGGSNDLENGPCKPFTLVFARGSGEPANMGFTVGPPFCTALKTLFGGDNVACQGVGSPYNAAVLDNLLPQGTTQAAIDEAKRLFSLAKTKCPNTKVIASGYSQGGAVMHGAIRSLDPTTQSMIRAAVMFGDSRNLQDQGRIPNYPTAQTKIICLPLDAVCLGTDLLTVTHLAYSTTLNDAVSFLRNLS